MRCAESRATPALRRSFRAAVVGIAAAFLLSVSGMPRALAGEAGTNATQQVEKAPPIPLPSLAPLVDQVLPAVVNISVQLGETAAAGPQGTTPFDQFLRHFFEHQFGQGAPITPFKGTPEKIMALGSGFIIDPSGYIVTNNHVVGHSKKVAVILQDGSRRAAKVVGRDKKTDLALLKIKAKKPLPYVTWGNSAKSKVGDWVVAIGNPYGLGGTVTAGIVSALGRNIDTGSFEDFLQIDAPINRGNSGGPTFNLRGQVIGINTAIYSPSGGSVGIGFDIPSNLAKKVVGELKSYGHATWGWLGVAIQGITPSIARALGVNPQHPAGALVAQVLPNSPAKRAGIKQGDIITSANGKPIETVSDLPRIVAMSQVGSKLTLTIRRNGKKRTVVATVGALPKSQKLASLEKHAAPHTAVGKTALGIELESLDPAKRRELQVPADVDGVAIQHISRKSPLAGSGLQPGDVIVSVNQKPVTTPDAAAAALKEGAARGNLLLLLNRHGVSQFVGLRVEEHPVPPGNAG